MDVNESSAAVVPRKSPASRPRKSWSLVWNDFTKERRADGSSVAICNHCSKQLTASSRSGTTHLKNHLVICTSSDRPDGRKKRKKLIVRRPPHLKTSSDEHISTPSHPADHFKFDQESSRQDLARMMILHQYPLTIVDDAGFRTFVRNLQPQFNLASYDAIKADCIKIYENTKLKLYDVLANLPSRISLSLETCKTGGDADYTCLTCYYIDKDWTLQKKMLNLMAFEALSTGDDVCRTIAEKIYEWNIHKKLFSVVMDNFSYGYEVAEVLPKYLSLNSDLLANGDYFHMHGYGDILDLIVHDGFTQTTHVINRVRESIKFVKSSQVMCRRFQEAAEQVHAPQKPLILDHENSWTSTYEMLVTACEFQDAFVRLAETDAENWLFLAPGDWEDLKAIILRLDLFSEAFKKFSKLATPTANLYFNDIYSIFVLLKDQIDCPSSVAVSMSSQMLKTFEQYWGITRMGMAIASILDPRSKMKAIEFFLKKLYGEHEGAAKIDEIRKCFTNLYNDYVVQSTNTSNSQALLCYNGSTSGSNNATDGVLKSSAARITLSDARRGLDQYLQQSTPSQAVKTDLDMYLEESVHPSEQGHDANFNVLAWWKVNAPKYPILSMMARDILAAPMSVVASDPQCRPHHQYMSFEDPITVQSLVCAHDWLKDEIEAATLDGDLSLVPANGEELCPVAQ